MKSTQEELMGRRERVYYKILNNPSIRTTELAEELNIPRRTLQEDLEWLEERQRIERDGYDWYANPPKKYPNHPLTISPEEGMMLSLAARLLVKLLDKRSLLAENMINKLAHYLAGDTGVGTYLAAAADQIAKRKHDGIFSRKLEMLFQAYLYHRWVRITYQPLNGQPFQTDFAPYAFEPSPVGMTIYTHGMSSIVNALRTYKVERILEIEVLSEPFELPHGFDGLAWLKNAASIIGGEETVEVRLRFSPHVKQRLAENSWFDFQEDLIPDGDYLILVIHVAHLLDLTPWVRSWGSDCEVLEPKELRDEMIGEARAIAKLYGVQTSTEGIDKQRFKDMFGE